jgi:hypothetical protein
MNWILWSESPTFGILADQREAYTATLELAWDFFHNLNWGKAEKMLRKIGEISKIRS